MATAADYGLQTPAGDEFVSYGDNAITLNAERAAELFDKLRFHRDPLSPVDLNTVMTPGAYALGAPYPTGFTNVPEGNVTASLMLVVTGGAGLFCARVIWQYGSDPRMWWQVQRAISGGLFSPWFEVPQGAASVSIPVNALATGSRAIREQLFYDAYPTVSTGGKGAVVFRYDHGLTNVKSTLLPLHQQYDIPLYIAMNSRNWGLEQNSGATQAEAAAWSGVEWGNHTADHTDKTGIYDIYDAIVNGRVELEAQLGTTIHGFTVPGVTEHEKFDGFGTGGAAGYSNSYAGSLVLAHHAVCSGTIGAAHRPLDGRLRIGARHWTWESSDFATIKAQIDAAASTKTALTLMCHPSTMAASASYWTPALAEQVIAYVRQLIDAGQLADITYYQSHNATL